MRFEPWMAVDGRTPLQKAQAEVDYQLDRQKRITKELLDCDDALAKARKRVDELSAER